MAEQASYERFLELIRAAGVYVPSDEIIEAEWETNIMDGGGWKDDATAEPRHDEPEPKFTDFEKILIAVAPNMPYLRVVEARNELIHVSTEYRDDYYGNHSDVHTKKLFLKELFAFLEKRELLKVSESLTRSEP